MNLYTKEKRRKVSTITNNRRESWSPLNDLGRRRWLSPLLPQKPSLLIILTRKNDAKMRLAKPQQQEKEGSIPKERN